MAPVMIKMIAWNIARREEAWRYLVDTDADLALLTEAAAPPADVRGGWRSIQPHGEQRAGG